MERKVACKQEHSKADGAASKRGKPNSERIWIERHGRSVPRRVEAGWRRLRRTMVRWKGCYSLPDGRRAIVRVDERIRLRPVQARRLRSQAQKRSAPLGLPIAAALA